MTKSKKPLVNQCVQLSLAVICADLLSGSYIKGHFTSISRKRFDAENGSNKTEWHFMVSNSTISLTAISVAVSNCT